MLIHVSVCEYYNIDKLKNKFIEQFKTEMKHYDFYVHHCEFLDDASFKYWVINLKTSENIKHIETIEYKKDGYDLPFRPCYKILRHIFNL